HLLAFVRHAHRVLGSSRQTFGEAQVTENERKRALIAVRDRTLTDVLQISASRVEIVAPHARDRELKARPPHGRSVQRRTFDRDGCMKGPARLRSTEDRLDHSLVPQGYG